MTPDKSKVVEALQHVTFPGKKESIITLNVVKDLTLEENKVSLTIVLPDISSPFKKAIQATVEDSIHRLVDKDCSVLVHFEEDETAKQQQAGGVKDVRNIIAIASGKGGVGKSTVTTNLAVALVKQGYSVGLIDADIFGPSIPKMFGVEGAIPTGRMEGEKDLIIPIEKYGVKMLSIGFFVKPEEAVAWRGPMAGNALKQLINDTDWGALDFLLLDLPPGTSDIQLTLVQTLSITGAVIVSTPQDVALIDAIKAIDFFQKDKVEVPVLGIVENMSWFTPAELPNNKYYIFGKGGAKKLAEEKGLTLLAELPIVQSIREGADAGTPVACNDDSILSQLFDGLASNVVIELEKRNQMLPPTGRVKIHV